MIMVGSILTLLVLAISAHYALTGEHKANIVCYYGTWATYRQGLGKFDVSSVNPHLCTHLVYTFVGIQEDGTIVSLDPYLDLPDNYGKDNFKKFNELKQINPELKTILAVGGWNEGSAKYSVMAANPTYRANFINSALKIILEYGFNGLDLDWEYPALRDTVNGQADVENFSQLLRELRAEFDKHDLLLSAAVIATEESASISYNVSALYQNLDIINLMTYDFYGAWDPVTGHNAGLHKGEGDEWKDPKEVYSVDVCVEYWLSQGCPSHKLALGVPFYGRTFILTNANVNGVRAPVSGAGIAGPYTVTSGTIGYNEFCDLLQTQSWDVHYDPLAKVPYAVQGSNWVSFDDPHSIAEKVLYARRKKLGGIMLWSIETDDFNGVCGEDFPLLRTINRYLGTDIDEETTTTSTTTSTSTSSTTTTTEKTTSTTEKDTTTTTTEKVTTNEPETETEGSGETPKEPAVACTDAGFIGHPEDCSIFYSCVSDGLGAFKPVQFVCSDNLFWDQQILSCNYPYFVDCKSR